MPRAALALAVLFATTSFAEEYLNGIPWAAPEMVEPGETAAAPPSDADVLIGPDGSMDAWSGQTDKWEIKDGVAVAGSRVETKEKYGDCQLHVEWRCPESEEKDGGQGRGNNGIGFMGAKYEVQVLQNKENSTYHDGQATAVYKQNAPLVNASRPLGEWQTYDILFRAPRFNEDGSVARPADVTVLHNGVLTQWGFELKGDTPYDRAPEYKKHPEKLPLVLMYHGDPVEFRNVWIRDLSGDAGKAQLKDRLQEQKEELLEEKPLPKE